MTSGKRRRGVWLLAAASGILVLGLAYVGTQYPASVPAPAVEKLRIATTLGLAPALLHIAVAKGYFAEEGLEVTSIPVSYGLAAIELVLAGKADLAAAAEVPFVYSVMNGADLGIAANMVSTSTNLSVIARRDRGIATPHDLVGKKIGIPVRSSGEYFLRALLIRHKLPPDSVVLVNVAPDKITGAIAAGTVDAVVIWQPFGVQAQSALGANAVTFTERAAYTESHVVVGRSEFLNAHPEAMAKLVRALLKAEELTASRPEETLNLVAGLMKSDVAALRPMWRDFNFRVNLLQSHLTTLEDEARWAMARGYVATGPVPNFLPHLYLDALQAVRPERVTVLH